MKKKTSNWQLPLKIFLIWRLSLIIISLIANLLTFRPDFAYTSPCYYGLDCSQLEKNQLYAWANFDGVHYLNIAAKGYTDQARFLPIYPLLIKIFTFGQIRQVNLLLSLVALIISNALLLLALYLFKRVFRLKKAELKWLLLLFLSFPTAFFLGSVYAESLVICLVLLMFWLLKKNTWPWAVLIAALLPVVKLQGLMIWPVLLFILFKNKNKFKLKFLSWLWIVVILVLPLLSYINFNYQQWQDPFYFIHAHGELANARATTSLVLPLQTVWRYLKILAGFSFNYEYGVAALELVSFIFLLYLFVLAWFKKLDYRYLLYSAVIVFLPLFSGTFSGLPRYMLLAFPLWIGLAKIKASKTKIVLILIFALAQLVLTICFLRGYFVG